MVLCDYYVMVQHISMEYVHHIVMQVLACWKVSAVWVLNSLNEKQKATCMGVCLEHLQYEKEGDTTTRKWKKEILWSKIFKIKTQIISTFEQNGYRIK
jgi:hypothetical protein